MRNKNLIIEGTVVVGIDDEERDSVFEVSIPKGITEIGEDAFWCCESLQIVKIPTTVTKIGNNRNAFYHFF